MKIKASICILYIFLLMSVLCSASEGYLPDESSETISAFAGFQFYSRTLKGEKEERIRQWVLPLFLAGRIAENLQLRIYQAASDSQLEGDSSLSGLGNTKIRASYTLFENALITYLGLSVPVNSIEPVSETARLSNRLYREVLDFGVNRVTSGLDLDLGFAFARPLGRLSLGFGMEYLVRGKYDRLSYDKLSREETLVDYSPGNPLSLSAGAILSDRRVNWGVAIIYINYANDRIGTENSFRNGDAISFRASVKPRLRPIAVRLFLEDTIKIGDDELVEGLIISNLFRSRLSGGLSLAYPLLADTITLNGQAVGKIFLDDDGVSAKVAFFGGGFRILLTDNLRFDFSANLMGGDMDAGETNVSGFDLGATVGYGF